MSLAAFIKIRPISFSIVTLTVFLFSSFSSGKADTADEISAFVKSGNTKEIAKFMAASVEMTILADENVYSKVQAEAALKDFFAKHPPTSVKLIHKINSNPNYRFTVLLLTTGNGAYRFSFGLKGSESSSLISEIRIEPNKD